MARQRGVGTAQLDWVVGNNEAEGLWRSMGLLPVAVTACRRLE